MGAGHAGAGWGRVSEEAGSLLLEGGKGCVDSPRKCHLNQPLLCAQGSPLSSLVPRCSWKEPVTSAL